MPVLTVQARAVHILGAFDAHVCRAVAGVWAVAFAIRIVDAVHAYPELLTAERVLAVKVAAVPAATRLCATVGARIADFTRVAVEVRAALNAAPEFRIACPCFARRGDAIGLGATRVAEGKNG